ncbi:MAG: WYL domain-containing protein [Actinomycetota bacterium]
MRTDRLVATLLLLQQREQVTAAEVARELEVSERTARRDLDALAMAGVPVYSIQGRGGGWRLVGGARTDLSGLTASEARALFVTAGPASTVTPEVKAALRKLVQALPEPFRADAEAAANTIVVDPQRWETPRRDNPLPPRLLEEIHDAVIRGVQIRLGYVDRGGAVSNRLVHPLGVVAKGSSWYLLGQTERGQRTFRVDRVSAVAPTDDPVRKPDDFDLAAAWRDVADEIDRKRAPLEVRGVCRPDGVATLQMLFGTRLQVGGPNDDGAIEVVIRGYDESTIANELAGLVSILEVTSPVAVRTSLASVGRALVDRYR